MKTLILALTVLVAGTLYGQNYNAERITSNYAGKSVASTGVKLMANGSVPWQGDLYDGFADDYPIGFNFKFYGQTYSTVDICINGWVSFKQLSGATPWVPISAPAQGPPATFNHDGALAGCWFDMWGYVMSNADGMFAQTVGAAPNREFRVDFHNMTKYGGPGGGTAAFCMVLYETSNRIEIHYGNITTVGVPFACGIENETGTSGVASPDGWLLTAPATSGYAFTLEPELDIERGSPIANNATDTVGVFTVGTPQTFDYTAFNRGDATLNLVGTGGNLHILTQNNCSATIVAAPPASIAAGASAVFSIQVAATAPGALDCTFEVISDDSDENPYTIMMTGTANAAPAPEIELAHNGFAVPSGGTTTSGSPDVGAAVPFMLRISNLGNGPLNLTGSPYVQVLNMVNCNVSVSVQPPSAIAAGGQSDCTLMVTPSSAGAFSFSVSVASNDTDENPYMITATGIGYVSPSGGTASGGGGGGCTATEGSAAAFALLLLALLAARRKLAATKACLK